MKVVLSYIARFFPHTMLLLFIMSLVICLTSPKGSEKRGRWKKRTITFGVISALSVLIILAFVGVKTIAADS